MFQYNEDVIFPCQESAKKVMVTIIISIIKIIFLN